MTVLEGLFCKCCSLAFVLDVNPFLQNLDSCTNPFEKRSLSGVIYALCGIPSLSRQHMISAKRKLCVFKYNVLLVCYLLYLYIEYYLKSSFPLHI